MKFNVTNDTCIELASAVAKIKETSRLLEAAEGDHFTQFELAWKLAFKHLQKLEDFRTPQ
jgi:hypothetical protein